MCNEARSLFREYWKALEAPVTAGRQQAEEQVRNAKGLLTLHNQKHGCCGTLVFEWKPADRRWRFRVTLPSR